MSARPRSDVLLDRTERDTHCGHARDLPVRWNPELGGECVAIEGPELADGESEQVCLEGQVCHRLTEVVMSELRVFEGAVLDELLGHVGE